MSKTATKLLATSFKPAKRTWSSVEGQSGCFTAFNVDLDCFDSCLLGQRERAETISRPLPLALAIVLARGTAYQPHRVRNGQLYLFLN